MSSAIPRCAAAVAILACAACVSEAPPPHVPAPALLDRVNELGCFPSSAPAAEASSSRTSNAPAPAIAGETSCEVGTTKEGACSKYWPERGKTRLDRTFKAGRLEGPAAWFDSAGRKIAEGAYHDDAPTGTWTAYFADGTKSAEVVLDKTPRRYTTWLRDGRTSMLVETDAESRVTRIDGNATSICAMLFFNVQVDRPWEQPFSMGIAPLGPCRAKGLAVAGDAKTTAAPDRGAK